jgi:ADP-ribose pyrophosphatase
MPSVHRRSITGLSYQFSGIRKTLFLNSLTPGTSDLYIGDMAKSAGTKSVGTKSAQGRVLSSRVRFQGPVFSVTTDEVEEPGGVRARRDVIRHSGSIVVLAVDEPARAGTDKSKGKAAEPRLLLERQYRHAAQSMMWELPAGRIDDGETALTAAKRELLEETGYSARQWKRILHFYVSPGFLDETMTIYLARGLGAGVAQPEADERIAVRFFGLSEAKQMALNGRIRDAKTIAGILWLAQMARTAR